MNKQKNMEEKPLEYFYRMLVEKKIKFSELVMVYTTYLEQETKENRKQIVESAFLLSMHNNPRLNMGTKEQLKNRTIKAIEKADIFPKSK